MSSTQFPSDVSLSSQYITTFSTETPSTQGTSPSSQEKGTTEHDSPHPSAKKAELASQHEVFGVSTADKIPTASADRAITPIQPDTAKTGEQSAIIEAVVVQPHLFAHVFSFCPPETLARAEQACHAFQNAGHIAELQYIPTIKQLAELFGIKDISFIVDDNRNIRLTLNDRHLDIINAIKVINSSLPERFRSKNSIELLIRSPLWLMGFFQCAYNCQLLSTLGEVAGVNQHECLNKQIYTITTWCAQNPLLELDATQKGLLILPQEIGVFSDLERLDISDNQISRLPPDIGQLSALKGFFVANNRLRELPPQLNQLANLQVLDVSGNQLESFLPNFDQLVNLMELDVHHNQLKTLPEALFHLPNLHTIEAQDNPDLTIPEAWIAEFHARGCHFRQ
jgi:hypothetical protein